MKLARLRNLLFCNRWSFRIADVKHSQAVAHHSDIVHLTGIVDNNGLRLGSAYIIVKVADPYDHTKVVFHSDQDLEYSQKQSLRIIDLDVNTSFRFSVPWLIDSAIPEGAYYYQAEIWNIPKLFRGKHHWFRYRNHCFDRSPWKPGIEILSMRESFADSGEDKSLKAFLSYSWDSTEHQIWVMELTDYLLRNGIDVIVDKRNLVPGEEITEFIERGISVSDILILVCSERYTQKANARIGGVGMETVISTAQFLSARRNKKFIPITRNNPQPANKKLPTYLGSTLYVDMDVDDWQGVPLQQLLKGIFKETGNNEHEINNSNRTSEQSGNRIKKTDESDALLVLSVAECAKILRVNEPTILDLLESGNLRGFSVNEEWRVTHQQLIEFLHTHSEAKRLEVIAQELSDPNMWVKEMLMQPNLREMIEKEAYPEGTFGRFLQDSIALFDINNSEANKG